MEIDSESSTTSTPKRKPTEADLEPSPPTKRQKSDEDDEIVSAATTIDHAPSTPDTSDTVVAPPSTSPSSSQPEPPLFDLKRYPLPNDVIGHTFQWFTLKELGSIISRVSHRFNHCTLICHSLEEKIHSRDHYHLGQFGVFVTYPHAPLLQKHVGHFVGAWKIMAADGLDILQTYSNLLSFDCYLCPLDLTTPVALPTRLTYLSIHFGCSDDYEDTKLTATMKYIESCLAYIATNCPLMKTLRIATQEDLYSTDVCLTTAGLESISQLTALTDLKIPRLTNSSSRDEVVKILQRMAVKQLQCLSPADYQWASADLADLSNCAEVSQFKLTDIGQIKMDRGMVKSLHKFGGLTSLESDCCSALPEFKLLLPTLSHLTSIQITCDRFRPPYVECFVSALADNCPQLKRLAVYHSKLTDQHYHRILANKVKLETLSVNHLDNLDFLFHPQHLATHLQVLTLLESCYDIPVSELQRLQSFKSLRDLFIYGSFREDLDPITKAEMTYGSPTFKSTQWPCLRTFIFEHELEV
jgi:hypothetical protein